MHGAGFLHRPDATMFGVASGLEMALWDIIGKATDQPVANLLGGRIHDELRAYTYLYPDEVRMLAFMLISELARKQPFKLVRALQLSNVTRQGNIQFMTHASQI